MYVGPRCNARTANGDNNNESNKESLLFLLLFHIGQINDNAIRLNMHTVANWQF